MQIGHLTCLTIARGIRRRPEILGSPSSQELLAQRSLVTYGTSRDDLHGRQMLLRERLGLEGGALRFIGSDCSLILQRQANIVEAFHKAPASVIIELELTGETTAVHEAAHEIHRHFKTRLIFQELPQLEADYGKVGMQKIITTCGNIFMGAARNKETLEWAQNDVFGKAKQTSRSISINDNKVSTTISEKMDYLVPAAKIADMATGWLAGQAARDFTATDDSMLNHFDIEQSEEFKTTKYFCKTHFDMKKIKDEEDHYVPLPKIYEFKNDREKEIMLNRNFKRVNDEVEKMVKELLGMA